MKKIEIFTTARAKETRDLGRQLGTGLKGGDLLFLSGELGAGKTTFLQGLAKGLGVKGPVNSPTFNILKLYKLKNNQGAKFFCHVDAYRLDGPNDLLALGFQEILDSGEYIIAIEWADRVKGLIRSIKPERLMLIDLKHVGVDARQIKIKRIIKSEKNASFFPIAQKGGRRDISFDGAKSAKSRLRRPG